MKATRCVRTSIWSGVLCFALTSPASPAPADSAAQAEIRAALTQWTADFNAGNAAKVCGLFAPDLIAQYRGQPERNYEALDSYILRHLLGVERGSRRTERREPAIGGRAGLRVRGDGRTAVKAGRRNGE